MLQLKNKNLVWVIVGASGSGKSSYAVSVLGNGKFTCRFIFDPSGEYEARFKRWACHVPAELRAAIATGWVIFNPHTMFPGDPQKALEKFCEWAWTMSASLPGQKILFADEVWKFCSPNLLPKSLAQIIQDGRKYGIGLLATTQRPNRLNETIIAEATELVSFQLNGTNALDYLRRNCDEFPVERLPALPALHYVAMNLKSGGIATGVVRF